MFENFINWRREADVDDIIDDFTFEERKAVQEVYPHGYHGIDLQGRPVYIEKIGMLNIPGLFEVTDHDRMLRHFI